MKNMEVRERNQGRNEEGTGIKNEGGERAERRREEIRKRRTEGEKEERENFEVRTEQRKEGGKGKNIYRRE